MHFRTTLSVWILPFFIVSSSIFNYALSDNTRNSCPREGHLDPCRCSIRSEGIHYSCFNITSEDQIINYFAANPPDQIIYHVYIQDLFLYALPPDVFGLNTINQLHLKCNSPDLKSLDPDVFRNSQKTLSVLVIESCSFPQLDLTFLTGFHNLEVLDLRNNQIKLLLNVPHLPGLQKLYLTEPVLESLYPFTRTPQLEHMSTTSTKLQSDNFKSLSTFCPSLKRLDVYNANLTEIPRSFMELEHLEVLYISHSPEICLETGSVNFSSTELKVLALESTYMPEIEPGAIVPVHLENTHFVLTYTDLRTFEEDVFRPVLETMEKGSGFLYLGGVHQFECGCDIAWLVHDHRHLLDKVLGDTGKRCQDGRTFDELFPEEFDFCYFAEDK